jgi:hypothetical protein
MPEKPKGSTPPENLHFDRSTVRCGHCGHTFKNFVIEEIDDLVQMRCGGVLVMRAELACLHCGGVFYWNIRDKEIEKLAVAYGQLVVRFDGYAPE